MPWRPAHERALDRFGLSVHAARLYVLCSAHRPVIEGSDQSGDRRSEKQSANEMKAQIDLREEMEKQ